MTVLYIIKTLLNDPIIQSYLISCGASASWDAMKLLGKKVMIRLKINCMGCYQKHLNDLLTV